MLDLDNRTGWRAGLYPGWSREGRLQMTVVVKSAFAFSPRGDLTPHPNPPPIEETDRYHGDPAGSSLAAACETVPFKAGGEILLSGTVHPPAPGRRVAEVTLGLTRTAAPLWEKTVRVFGARRWEKGILGLAASPPEPLAPLPLRYEFAYGGRDPGHPENIYAPNPVGKGYSQKGWGMAGRELPQIEMPPKFISGATARVPPAGFGPLSPLWEPRLKAFDLFDREAAVYGGSPFGERALPETYNAAPVDQRFSRPFCGGETLRLKGFIPEARAEEICLTLPRLRPQMRLHWQDEEEPRSLQPLCDTVIVDTDARTVCLLWRAAAPFSLRKSRTGWVVLQDPNTAEIRGGEGGP